MAALRAMYGLPIKSKSFLRGATGRSRFPSSGFREALFLTGRRSGKSRISSVIGAYEAAISGRWNRLSRGEIGLVTVTSPTRVQSRIVRAYMRALFDSTPMLKAQVAKDTKDGFLLRNGVEIQILAGDFRTVRGFTQLAVIIDEICFFGVDEESKVKSDTELIKAIRPALRTTGGPIVGISSPYAKKGYAYSTWKRDFGNEDGRALVVNCPSFDLNTTITEDDLRDEIKADPAAARSEVYAQFRDDISDYLTPEVVEAVTAFGRRELMYTKGKGYRAFVDVSGGRSDDAALAIGHLQGRTVVLDKLQRWKPPFNPYDVIGDIAQEIKRFEITKVTGDNYAAEFVAQAFTNHGLRYIKSPKPKGQLYIELLPRINSCEIELLDNEKLRDQLCNLERRTRAGGKDIIDHPQGGHDDLANAVAGVADTLATGTRIGAL